MDGKIDGLYLTGRKIRTWLECGIILLHEQKLDCGGGYMKLLNGEVNQKIFSSDTPYRVSGGRTLMSRPRARLRISKDQLPSTTAITKPLGE
ncbi:hypothetical protein LguiA_001230 [Lonicera macranthoides]